VYEYMANGSLKEHLHCMHLLFQLLSKYINIYQVAYRCSDLVFYSVWKEGIELADQTTNCNGCGKCSGEFSAANGTAAFALSIFKCWWEESIILWS
jgi:hypothetical protein